MAKQKQQARPDSFRWPNLFAHLDEAALLFQSQGWEHLLADCQEALQDLAAQVVHKIPTTKEAEAEQNFLRGKIAQLEDFIELHKDFEHWKKARK